METHQLLLVSGIGLAINLWGMWATGGHHHHGHSHGHDHAQVHAAPKVVSFRWNRDISYWLKLRRYTNREYPKMTLINMKIIILIFTVMTITTNLAPYVSFPLANSLSCFSDGNCSRQKSVLVRHPNCKNANPLVSSRILVQAQQPRRRRIMGITMMSIVRTTMKSIQ